MPMESYMMDYDRMMKYLATANILLKVEKFIKVIGSKEVNMGTVNYNLSKMNIIWDIL